MYQEILKAAAARVLAVDGDVNNKQDVYTAVQKTLRRFHQIDILVNNAAVFESGKRLHETDEDSWERVLNINLIGVFRMTKAVITEMLLCRRGGVILNISSIAGLIGLPRAPIYAASKGGLNALNRALAVDYAGDGIRCNLIAPALVDTPMMNSVITNPEWLQAVLSTYAIKRPGTPEEIAYLALYLASDEARWVTGATFRIDGGMSICKS